MQNRFVSACLSLLTVTSVALPFSFQVQPALAETENVEAQSNTASRQLSNSANSLLSSLSGSSSSRSYGSLIAREDYLSVTSPYGETIAFQGDHPAPIVLSLNSPLFNDSGDVIVPAGADIAAHVTRTEDGRAQIVADMILVEGMAIKLKAVSSPLLITATETKSASANATAFNATYGVPINMLGGVLAGDDPELDLLLSNIGPVAAALFSRPNFERSIELEQDKVFFLEIQERIVVPVEVAEAIRQSTMAAANIEPVQAEAEPIQAAAEPVQAESESADETPATAITSSFLESDSLCLPANICEEAQ